MARWTPNKESGKLGCGGVYSALRLSELTGEHPHKSSKGGEKLAHLAATRYPTLIKEHEVILGDTDKIFASQWLSENEVVCGTKCNQLFIYNFKKKFKLNIPLLHGHDIPSASVSNCGIHSIAINPSRTLLATGGINPNHIGVYHLPSFEPFLICEGHRDWVFSLQWMSDDLLVSGSRDSKVCWWSMNKFETGQGARYGMYTPSRRRVTISEIPMCSPAAMRLSHKSKVRDLKYNPHTKELATLSADTSFKIWDVQHLQPVSSLCLSQESETVCIALDKRNNIYAVGSQSHITFIDPRSATVTSVIDSLDRGSGVRSLSVRDNVVTIGGGFGRLSFYDMCSRRYITLSGDEGDGSAQRATQLCHRTGLGWLRRNDVYYTYFSNIPVYNAIYTHAYDEHSERLFVAGGPLQLGLCGGYAGLWY